MNLLHLIVDAGCSAAIFDMDGVVTETTGLHSRAWKQAFDELLTALGTVGAPAGQMEQFDIESDYYEYVDGRTRLEGIRAFLASRHVSLPLGSESDSAFASMNGLGSYKNALYLHALSTHGVNVYPDAVELICRLRNASLRIGLATSSKNAHHVLRQSGLEALFDIVVDGNDVNRLCLRSKPAPDIFIYTAERLNVPLRHCAVFEDSLEALVRVSEMLPGYAIGVSRNDKRTRAERFGALTLVNSLTAQ